MQGNALEALTLNHLYHTLNHPFLQIGGEYVDYSLRAEFPEIAKKKTHCSISCDCHLFKAKFLILHFKQTWLTKVQILM
jgi:hypothetical protein